MKKILLGFAILLLITSSSCSQESKQPLQFTIKSDKKVYEVGEDIKINFKFINQSKDTIKIKVGRQDLYNFFEFFISRNGGKPRRVGSGNVEDIYEEKIAPGESYSFDGLINKLDMRAMKPIFYEHGRDNTGRYEITITYRDDITITSNTITIEVVGKKITKEVAFEIAKRRLQKESFANDIDFGKFTVHFREKTNDYVVDFARVGAGDITGRGMWARGYYVVIDANAGEIKEAVAYKR